ncbi:MAG TPA: ATP synthase F1 subunit gamma [Phycisphaerales bacterium]|nr:ATP synthase F1 subunit gamma [Phycisphaerales bacterium]
MGKTREIKKRIKAVGNIRRITKTMQMIATSKFARAQSRATATKPYTLGVFELVRELAATAGNVDHPLLTGPKGVKVNPAELTLILTSDRGLAGPYNGSILRTAMQHLRQTPRAREGVIELSGKKGVNFLRFNRVPVAAQHHIGDKASFEQVERLADSFMERFIRGEVSAVRVIYMKYISAGRQRPEVMQLLPLRPPVDEKAAARRQVLYEFSPPAEELLGGLIPAAVRATLMQAVNDSIVSEHVARMVAMKSATDNAGKMGKRLTRAFNRARQAQITTELTEIVAGAAALE